MLKGEISPVLTQGLLDDIEEDDKREVKSPTKPTLEFALRPHKIPLDTVREHHGPVLGMITKLLGVTPRHTQYMYLWPPGFETMCVIVPNMLDIPFCDFGIGTLHGELRSLTCYVAARSFGCAYCSAHCASMGTIWYGDSVFLQKNAASLDSSKSGQTYSPKDLAAMNLAQKLARIPCEVQTEDVRILATALSMKEQESIVNAIAAMGYLTRFMSTIGMTLEIDRIGTGKQYLASSGWDAGSSYDSEADAELMRDDLEDAAKQAEQKKKKGFFDYVLMVLGAKAADMRAMSKIPSSEDGIAKRCKEAAGFVPYYLKKVQHGNARSAMAWAFLLRLLEGTEEVPATLKQMMCFLSMTNSGNNILRAHSAFLANRFGVPVERLVSLAKNDGTDSSTGSAKEIAAIALAQATSYAPSRMTPILVGLLSRQYSPAGLIELLSTVSVLHLINVWTSFYVPTEYEPEIAEFLREHGEALEIDPENPCSPEQREWEATARKARKPSGLLTQWCKRLFINMANMAIRLRT